MQCPICDSLIMTEKYKLFDDRYGYKEEYALYECQQCGHKYIPVDFNEEELIQLYTQYYPRINWSCEDYKVLEYSPGFNTWFNGVKRAFAFIPENVKVLDIGCGFGQALGYHKNRGCDVWGVETDSNVKKISDKFGLNIKIGTFDPSEYQSDFFDYITMDQVLEHVQNPLEMLSGIKQVLKPGGKLILTLPNASSFNAWFYRQKWINWHVPYHIHHYSKKSMRVLAKKSGLSLEKITTHTSSSWLSYQWKHNVVFPKQGEKSLLWTYKTHELPLHQKKALRRIDQLNAYKINHVFTRVLDIFGSGDSFVVILGKES